MDVLNLINKFSNKLTNYFKNIENNLQNTKHNFLDNIIPINNKIIFWIKDSLFPSSIYFTYFSQNYGSKFLIYNISQTKLDTDISQDKIIDFNIPNNPSLTLEFLISFCISAENWINVDLSNILIIYDDILKNEGQIFYILSALISFHHTKKNDSIFEPISIYADLTSIKFNNNQEMLYLPEIKNNLRYLNYFSQIQKSPLIVLKKIFLKTIMISGAPAIDNDENEENGHFITINKNSYYIPIIRIKSNNKYIYSSYNPNNTENKLTKMKYSDDNVIKFEINKYLFNDILIEVLHKSKKCFKLLFTIQFNTFFVNNIYSIKFSRDQIDSIHTDIRYPTEFFVDLHLDHEKEEKLSSFDDYSIYWKSLLSEFISKSLKDKNGIQTSSKDKKEDKNTINNNIDINININKEINEDIYDIGNTNNTLDKVNLLLKQLEGNNNANNSKEVIEEENNEEVDEDIQNYLKSLENK